MLAAESQAARRRWPGGVTNARVVERLGDRRAEWEGPGSVAVAGGRLVFRGPTVRRTSLGTVERVVARDDLVWVWRRRAHDWLIWCASPADADALADAFAAVRLEAAA